VPQFRLAVVSDIHGNLAALDAVRLRINDFGCDEILNLGDCLSGPLEAAATADRLMDLGWKTIRGNHDRHLIDRTPDRMGQSDQTAHGELRQRHFDWLAGLPAYVAAEYYQQRVYGCHATPSADNQYLLETIRLGGVYTASQSEVVNRLTGIDADVILTGHSHIPRVVSLPDGRLVVNPGSVGLPAYDDDHPILHYMEVGSTHARFATLDLDQGQWSVANHAVQYDNRYSSELAVKRQREDWAHALRTGFALRR
jgi:predicted phosphodiesterase